MELLDKNKEVLGALRTIGFNMDEVACEIILNTIELVHKNQDSMNDTTVKELTELKKVVEPFVQNEMRLQQQAAQRKMQEQNAPQANMSVERPVQRIPVSDEQPIDAGKNSSKPN